VSLLNPFVKVVGIILKKISIKNPAHQFFVSQTVETGEKLFKVETLIGMSAVFLQRDNYGFSELGSGWSQGAACRQWPGP